MAYYTVVLCPSERAGQLHALLQGVGHEDQGIVPLHHLVLVGLPGLQEFFSYLGCCGTCGTDVFCARDLCRFAKATVDAFRDPLVVHVSDCRT